MKQDVNVFCFFFFSPLPYVASVIHVRGLRHVHVVDLHPAPDPGHALPAQRETGKNHLHLRGPEVPGRSYKE